jgi:hypothetical protein
MDLILLNLNLFKFFLFILRKFYILKLLHFKVNIIDAMINPAI